MRIRALAALGLSAAAAVVVATVHAASGASRAEAPAPCTLGNGAGSIKHVVYLQFDNTHYRTDYQSVTSDLRQMPHLLNFLKSNGVGSTGRRNAA